MSSRLTHDIRTCNSLSHQLRFQWHWLDGHQYGPDAGRRREIICELSTLFLDDGFAHRATRIGGEILPHATLSFASLEIGIRLVHDTPSNDSLHWMVERQSRHIRAQRIVSTCPQLVRSSSITKLKHELNRTSRSFNWRPTTNAFCGDFNAEKAFKTFVKTCYSEAFASLSSNVADNERDGSLVSEETDTTVCTWNLAYFAIRGWRVSDISIVSSCSG